MLIDTSEWAGTALCEGRYRVLRKLGEGGMAHVYVAHDDKLERDVVIKVPRANLIHDSAFAGRFTREVRSLAKLAHPHIVPLMDIGQHDGVPFAVMHFLTGGSLRDRQPRTIDGQYAPMPVDNLHSWLAPIAQALDFIHKNKYVHRDVKPENILFDEDGQPFLSDLGIVKALTENQDQSQRTVMTVAGMVLGTPHYMAPELILGETVDGRADQYALGVVLYEVLTGQFPFNGASAPAIFIQQTTKSPRPLRDIAPNVPTRLAAAVEKAMAKAPRDRFATCVEFVQAAIGAGGAAGAGTELGAPAVAATVLEHRAFRDEPVLGTLIEHTPSRTDTPSDLRNPTRAMTAPAAQLNTPAPRSSKKWLVAGIAVVAIAGAVAAFFLTRGEPPELKLAEVKAFSLLPGEKKTIRVEIERQRFDGDVSRWLDGLPVGVKAERLVLPAGKTEGPIDLTIPPDAAPRKVTATLRAKGQHVETSQTVDIVIDAPLASLRFLPIKPRTILADKMITVEVQIERKNCGGEVALELKGLPDGVTWQRSRSIDPVIPADKTSYSLVLKAAANASSALEAKVIVKGKLKSIEAEDGELLLTVVAAPSTPKDPTPSDPIVKNDTPTPDPKNGTKISKQTEKGDGKGTQQVKNDDKKPEAPVVAPQVPPELIVAHILDVIMYPGDRATVWVQIERKNCAGPVNIAVAGLPLDGSITLTPMPQETIPATRLATSFDISAAPFAPSSKRGLTVTASLGDQRVNAKFNIEVIPTPQVKKKPPPEPKKLELLSQKEDKLTPNDPLDLVKKSSYSKSIALYFVAGRTYTIDMISDVFDSYLRIEHRNKKGVSIVENDNGGGGLNARVVFVPEESAVYHLIATSVAPGSLGAFKLEIYSEPRR